MPITVAVHQLTDLAHGNTKNEILLDTNINTELHIISDERTTTINLPFGNRFDIVDGCIIIHEKK